MDLAVAPLPTIAARSGASSPWARHARTKPGTSVLCTVGLSPKTMVLPTPNRRVGSSGSPKETTASLCGAVTLSPTHSGSWSRARTNPPNSSVATV